MLADYGGKDLCFEPRIKEILVTISVTVSPSVRLGWSNQSAEGKLLRGQGDAKGIFDKSYDKLRA